MAGRRTLLRSIDGRGAGVGPTSTLDVVRRLVALRKASPTLGAVVDPRAARGYPVTCVRAETHVVVNRGVSPRPWPSSRTDAVPLLHHGIWAHGGLSVDGAEVTADGFAYGVVALRGSAPASDAQQDGA